MKNGGIKTTLEDFFLQLAENLENGDKLCVYADVDDDGIDDCDEKIYEILDCNDDLIGRYKTKTQEYFAY